MAMQMEASKLREGSVTTKPEIWIDEFGRFDKAALDLQGKNYQGRVYRLTPEECKVVAETIGFTARFDHANIRQAYVDIANRTGTLTTEITKNTKPTDIALRYAADRWAALERPKNSESLRPWLRSQYQARLLPDKTLIALAELLKLKIEERDNFYIRVNFKDQTFALIAEKEQAEKFPIKAFSVFSLGNSEIALVNSSDPIEYNADQGTRDNMTENNQEPTRQSPQPLRMPSSSESSSPGTKYATYSMSEVDQLLKQQSELIINTLSAKVNAQQKVLQESLKTQEINIGKIVDDLHAYGDSVRKRIESAEAQQKDMVQKVVEQTKNGLLTEIEQFKVYVNKSVTPNIKVLDDRVKAIVSEHQEKATPKEKKLSYGMILTLLALVISIVDLILVLFKHRLL
jgi:hypothetical protein